MQIYEVFTIRGFKEVLCIHKGKFIKTNLILIIIVGAIIGFTTNTYSKVETKYKEEYVYSGDTLWSIAQNELENNKYFEGNVPEYVGTLNDVDKEFEEFTANKLKVVEETAKIFEETLQIKLTKDEMYYIVSMI